MKDSAPLVSVMNMREEESTDPKIRTKFFFLRWFPFVNTMEGADKSLGFGVKMKTIFSST